MKFYYNCSPSKDGMAAFNDDDRNDGECIVHLIGNPLRNKTEMVSIQLDPIQCDRSS